MSRTSRTLRRLSVPVLAASMLVTGLGGLAGTASAVSGLPNGTLTLTVPIEPSQTIGDTGSIVHAVYNQGSGSGLGGLFAQNLSFTASGSAKFANGTNTTTCTTSGLGDGGSCDTTLLRDTVSEAVTVAVTDSSDTTVPVTNVVVHVASLQLAGCPAGVVDTTTNCVTQVNAGVTTTATSTYLQDGAGKDGATVTFTLPSGSGVFTSVQPIGTAFVNTTTVACTTSGGGKCNVTYLDNTVATHVDVLHAVTSNVGAFPASVADQTINVVASTTPGRLSSTTPVALVPAGGTAFQPGTAVHQVVRLTNICAPAPGAFNCTGISLANVSVALTVDHGFFTPDCMSADAGHTVNYAQCSFTPAAAVGGAVGNLVNSGKSKTFTTDATGSIAFSVGIARDAGFDDQGTVAYTVSGVATGSTATLPVTVSGDGVAAQTCAAGTNQPGCPLITTWSTRNVPLNGGAITFKAVDASDITKTPNHVPLPQSRTYVVQAVDQFGNLTSDLGDPNPITLAAVGAPDLALCTGTVAYSLTVPCTTPVPGGGVTTDSAGVVTRTYTGVTPSYIGLFATNGSTTQSRYQAKATAVGLQTDTVTWKPLATTFNTFTAATAVGPAVATYTQTSAAKTASVAFDFYNQTAQPIVTFTATPGHAVNPGTVVTVAATVKDQFGAPIPGAKVSFFRTGPNEASCSPSSTDSTGSAVTVTSDATGTAAFTFGCNSSGTSTVTIVVKDAAGNELARGTQAITFNVQGTAPLLFIDTTGINVGQSAHVTVQGTPGQAYTLFALTRPDTVYHGARSGVFPTSGSVTYAIAPRGNTRLFARTAAGDSSSVAVSVRPAEALHGLAEGKIGSFSGQLVPGHGGVTVRLFTVKSGAIAFVGSTVTDASGFWSFSRRFAATGPVTFISQTLSDSQNLAGQSNRVTITFR